MHGIQNANSINQKGSGCNFSGMLLVKKVPGTLHFSARAPGHTIDYLSMNMSHHVHHLYFGNKPTKKNRMLLESKFPQYFESGWLDKMAGQAFIAENPGATYEHYLQTVLTTVEPTSSPKVKAARSINVYVSNCRAGLSHVVISLPFFTAHFPTFPARYEYTAQSHAYDAEDHASVKARPESFSV